MRPPRSREKALAILDEGIRDYRSWRQKRDMTEEVRRLCASFGERTAERFAASAEREEPEKAAALGCRRGAGGAALPGGAGAGAGRMGALYPGGPAGRGNPLIRHTDLVCRKCA